MVVAVVAVCCQLLSLYPWLLLHLDLYYFVLHSLLAPTLLSSLFSQEQLPYLERRLLYMYVVIQRKISITREREGEGKREKEREMKI